MNKNRQQLKTGLRAILGGGLREETAPSEVAETSDAPASEPEPTATVIVSPPEALVQITPPAAQAREAAAMRAKPNANEVQYEQTRVVVVVPEDPVRKSRKKPLAPPPPEPKVTMAPSVRVGTLENPYVRKRDNLPTRKVGIVLPVALAERMQIHCVKARIRPNEFVARAIEALLDELQA